jgi:cytochrome c-type biogenesis protein CcmF
VTTVGQILLLFAFVAAGYSAFACAIARRFENRWMQRSGYVAAFASVGALSVILFILIRALALNDFGFAYVAQYGSTSLPWHYAISALWVGQAGSLLLWSWLLGVVALLFRFWPGNRGTVPIFVSTKMGLSPLGQSLDIAFSILLTYLTFLLAVMIFGADPMEASLSSPRDGAGLSPLLRHPAMLVHPPIVFLGYALWAIPFALALSALLLGRDDRRWLEQARAWILCAWTVLGLGILLGAKWAYDELGWGGYWGWDPVENGSLMPWLTGTALIHCGLAWRYRGSLKKTALLLAIITFGLCNFAAFLTRSGVFGSLHEFSKSPIGWFFLLLMGMLVLMVTVLITLRRKSLAADNPITCLSSREACLTIAAICWLGLALVVFLGTAAEPLSRLMFARALTVGSAFYNHALMPVGLMLLLTTAAAPALKWGSPLERDRLKVLCIAFALSLIVVLLAVTLGARNFLMLAVIGSAFFAFAVFPGVLFLDSRSVTDSSYWRKIFTAIRLHCRRYAGFAVHLGFIIIAVGVAASSLGTDRLETAMLRGETVSWAGRSVRFAGLHQQLYHDRLAIEAELEINSDWRGAIKLFPAKHLCLAQNQWTTEVAIDSSWAGDFYVILDSGRGEDQIYVTLVNNPLMCWIWLGGALIGLSALVALWPARTKIVATHGRIIRFKGLVNIRGKSSYSSRSA